MDQPDIEGLGFCPPTGTVTRQAEPFRSTRRPLLKFLVEALLICLTQRHRLRPLNIQLPILFDLGDSHGLMPVLQDHLWGQGISSHLKWPQPKIDQAGHCHCMEAVSQRRLTSYDLLIRFSLILGLLLEHPQRVPSGVPHEALSLVHRRHSNLLGPFMLEEILLLVGVRGVLHPVSLPPFNCRPIARGNSGRRRRWPPFGSGDGSGEGRQSRLFILHCRQPFPSLIRHMFQRFRPFFKNHFLIQLMVPAGERWVILQFSAGPIQPRPPYPRQATGANLDGSGLKNSTHLSDVLLITYHIFQHPQEPDLHGCCSLADPSQDLRKLIKQFWPWVLQVLSVDW